MVELASATVAGHTHFTEVTSTASAEVWSFSGDRLTRRQTRRLKWVDTELDQRQTGNNWQQEFAAPSSAYSRLRPTRPVVVGGLDARTAWRPIWRNAGVSLSTTGPSFNKEVSIAEMTAIALAEFRYLKVLRAK